MTKRRWRLAIGAAVLAAAAVAATAALSLGGGGSAGRPSHAVTGKPSLTGYAGLWQETRVGEQKAVVLRRWPKDPYQHYGDNLKDDCYEWMGTNLYNLCFKDGVLRSKELF